MVETPEYRFVLEGLRARSVGERPVQKEPLDPLIISGLALRHGLAALMADWLPKDHPAQTRLETTARLASVRSMAAAGALIDLSKALTEAGIPHLQFKGPSTALRFYDDLRARPFMDIDLLVQPDFLWAAHRVAQDTGFELDDRLRSPYLHRTNAKHLSHIKGPVRIELHRRLSDYPGHTHNSSFEELWSRRDSFEVGHRSVPCLSKTDSIYHAALHGTGHGFTSLKWLADLIAMMPHEADWCGALEIARDERMEEAFLCGPAMLRTIGATVAGTLDAALDRTSRKRGRLEKKCWEIVRRGQETYDTLWIRHRMLPPLSRFKSSLGLIFGPDVRDWAAMPGISPDTPLLFSILRPFRIAGRHGTRLLTEALNK